MKNILKRLFSKQQTTGLQIPTDIFVGSSINEIQIDKLPDTIIGYGEPTEEYCNTVTRSYTLIKNKL